MIRIEAHKDITTGEFYNAHIWADKEDLAKLPKSIGIKSHGQGWVKFGSDQVNGGVNETGARRMRSLLRNADKHGIGVVFHQQGRVQDELNARHWGMTGSLLPVTRPEMEAMLATILG